LAGGNILFQPLLIGWWKYNISVIVDWLLGIFQSLLIVWWKYFSHCWLAGGNISVIVDWLLWIFQPYFADIFICCSYQKHICATGCVTSCHNIHSTIYLSTAEYKTILLYVFWKP